MRHVVRAMKALGDETRLRILNLLLERECCVCEVMQVLGISQTRASRNLATLYGAGLLHLRREGAWAYYSIDWDRVETYAIELIKAVKDALEGNEVARNDLIRLEKAERLGPVCSREEVVGTTHS
jgi:ArsR family transcriptional regulator